MSPIAQLTMAVDLAVCHQTGRLFSSWRRRRHPQMRMKLDLMHSCFWPQAAFLVLISTSVLACSAGDDDAAFSQSDCNSIGSGSTRQQANGKLGKVGGGGGNSTSCNIWYGNYDKGPCCAVSLNSCGGDGIVRGASYHANGCGVSANGTGSPTPMPMPMPMPMPTSHACMKYASYNHYCSDQGFGHVFEQCVNGETPDSGCVLHNSLSGIGCVADECYCCP